MTRNGLIIVYTGNGKGKTTAALGAALRSASRAMKTLCIQFLKSSGKSGEQEIPGALEQFIRVIACGKGFVFKDDEIGPHKRAALKGWQLICEELANNNFDVLILDEIASAINLGLLAIKDVIDFLESRQRSLHVILTGRDMPAELIAMADTVTEMKEIKHAYQSGVAAFLGIDF
jgi:cob(I)alamin adenosyltransferase